MAETFFRIRRIFGLGWLALCVSCTDEEIAPRPNTFVIEGDGYSLTFETTSIYAELKRGDDVLTTLDSASFALGTVDTVDDTVNYDPYPLLAESPGYLSPAGTAFHDAEKVTAAVVTDTSIELDLLHEGGLESHVSITLEEEGHFSIRLSPKDASHVVWLRVGTSAADGEAFYGLGEYFDDVNQRGKLRAMQLEVDDLESGYNEAHVPIPFVIGTNGWGLFVESSYPGAFDVSSLSEGHVAATFGVGGDADKGIVAHLFAADHPMNVTKRYYDVTGYPRLPATWALGPLVWRDENENQAQVEQDVETMRLLDLAASGIWIDRPYATGVNTFDWDPNKFTDAQAMIDEAHALGFRVSVWHTPYLDEADPSTQALRDEAEEKGYYPTETGIQLNNWGKPLDFTVHDAVTWWQDHLTAYTSMGIEGFKLDYAEDVVPGIFGARNVFEFHDGSDERTMHRGYTLLYHSTYAALLPEEGGFLLCRAGKWGDQTNGPIIWPGDLDARLWKHRQEITEDGETFKAVGGLHASMIAGLTLGPSGFPFYGSDTGGYQHSPPDKETFRRWFEQTALSTVMQIGTSSNDVAWEFDDLDLLDSYRIYTRLHLRLFPYEWSLAQEMLATGHPIERPFGLAHPEIGKHPSDQYFFGDALLVAPVTDASVSERSVVFPDGDWIDFWDGTVLSGGDEQVVAAPLGKLPLFLRRGSIVPMLRPTIDTLAPTTEPESVDSFATDAGPLWVLTSSGPESSFDVYDGTGISQAEAADGASTVIEITRGSVFSDAIILEAIAFGEEPSRVIVDGVTLEPVDDLDDVGQGYVFSADERGGTLTAKVAPGPATQKVTLER